MPARWAMEHDLLPDLNDQDTELPPEQVKFYPDNMVTKIERACVLGRRHRTSSRMRSKI